MNFLNSGYELEDILKEGNFGTFPSAEDCINYLVENGYLSGEGETISAESISKKYTVAQLKELLKENGLNKIDDGKKVSRLSLFLKQFQDAMIIMLLIVSIIQHDTQSQH